MKRALAAILSSLLVVMPAFADRTVYAPVRLAPTATAGTVLFGDSVSGASPAISFSADPDTGIYRAASNRLGFSTGGAGRVFIDDLGWLFVGNAVSSPSPTTGNISGTLGSGTNIGGGDLRINGGQSTGSGAGGNIIFRTTAAGASGSSSNGATERMRITSDGEVGIGSSTATGNRLALTYTTASGVAKIGPNSTGGNTSLAFGTSASGTYADRMTITSAGEILAGTSTAQTGSRYVFDGTTNNFRIQGDTLASFHLEDKGASDASRPFQYLISDDGNLIFGNANRNGTGTTSSAERMRITSDGTIVFGNGLTAASPTNTEIRATAGSGTDIAGANLTISGGRSTGSAAGGAVIFRTTGSGASGSAENSITERMRVKTNGQVRFVPLTADPAGAEAGDVYYNSSTNKLKVYNGTAWVDLH